MRLLNPTGKPVRMDRQGSGLWNARRGARRHKGVDFLCDPGQEVLSPIDGFVLREARPYEQGVYSGLVIQAPDVHVKIFYIDPLRELIGGQVLRGQPIGYAQDISAKYAGGMLPHVHLQIDGIDPMALMIET